MTPRLSNVKGIVEPAHNRGRKSGPLMGGMNQRRGCKSLQFSLMTLEEGRNERENCNKVGCSDDQEAKTKKRRRWGERCCFLVGEGGEESEGRYFLLVVEVSGSTQGCGWGRAFCQL